MPAVTCPSCGAVVQLKSMARTAEEFCPTPGCDYPLFWARGSATDVVDDPPAMQVVRRRPGTGGRQVQSPECCPVCQEPNRITAVFCQRCGAEMHPQPAPPEPLPPPPRPELSHAPSAASARSPRRSPWSDWRVIAVLVVLLVMLEMTASLVLLSRS